MSEEKIKNVVLYLGSEDKNVRAKALVKLKEYIARGYDRKKIIKEIKKYIKSEKEEKLLDFARQMTGNKHSLARILLPVLAIFIVILLIVFLLPVTKKNEGKHKSEISGFTDSESKGNIESKEVKVDLSEALKEAQEIDLGSLKKFSQLSSFQNSKKLVFNPARKSKITSNVKIKQKTTTNGIKMSDGEISFKIEKNILKKEKDRVSFRTKVFDKKGLGRPELFGFPPSGKNVIFTVSNNMSIMEITDTKNKAIDSSYMLPLPIFPDKNVSVGETWGSEVSNENFGLISQYKVDGIIETDKKNILQISFLSVSESRSRDSNFSVSRKGIFYVDVKTGVPQFLKISTISKTELKETGFPVEHELIIEENVL